MVGQVKNGIDNRLQSWMDVCLLVVKGKNQITKEILLLLLVPRLPPSPAYSSPGNLYLLCRRTPQKLERVTTADVRGILVTAGF